MIRDSAICRRMSRLLPGFADGLLPPAEAASVERHLADCAVCRRRLAVDEKLGAALAVGDAKCDPARAVELRRRVWERVERERRWIPVRRAGGQIVRAAGAVGAVAVVALFAAAVVVVGRPIVEERAAASRPALTAAPRPAAVWPGPVAISVFQGGREDVFEPGSPTFEVLATSIQAVVSRTVPNATAAVAAPDGEARRVMAEGTAVEIVYLGSGVSAEISMLIPLDTPAGTSELPILVGDGDRYNRVVLVGADKELVELRRVLGVREPAPVSTPAEPTEARVVPAPTTAASRAAIDDGAWEKLARSVTGVETILRPEIVPDKLGPVSILKAEHSWFEVEYRAEGRRLYMGVGVFNPPMVDEKGEQHRIVVRGQPATLQIGDRANPKEQVIVWWDEPGHWSLSPGDDSARDRISYLVGAEGLSPEEVERVVASLRPEPRPALPTPAAPTKTAGPTTPRATPTSTPRSSSSASRLTSADTLISPYYWVIDGERVDRTPSLSPDGSRLVYLPLIGGGGADQDRLIVRDLATGKDRDLTPEPGYSYTGARWSPDGQSLAFVKFRPDRNAPSPTEVWRLDLDGSAKLLYQVPGTIPDQGGPALGILRWSSDGRFVEVSGTIWGGGAAKLVRADGSGAENRVSVDWRQLGVADGSLVGEVAFSPGGDYALYIVKTKGRLELSSLPAEGDRSLLLYDLATGRRYGLAAFAGTIYVDRSAISPDGGWIAYSTVVFPPSGPRKEHARLWVVPREGREAREVADERGQPVHAETVYWLDGGRALVQTRSGESAGEERSRLLLLDAASGVAREVAAYDPPWNLVSASRDGRRALVVRGGEKAEIRLIGIAP